MCVCVSVSVFVFVCADSGKQKRIRLFSGDSMESGDFRDSRDPSSEKAPFVMTPFSVPIKVSKKA